MIALDDFQHILAKKRQINSLSIIFYVSNYDTTVFTFQLPVQFSGINASMSFFIYKLHLNQQ